MLEPIVRLNERQLKTDLRELRKQTRASMGGPSAGKPIIGAADS